MIDSDVAVELVMLKHADAAVTGSEDVLGYAVHDRANREIGQVDDLAVDRDDARVRYLVIGEGGLLGLGRTHRLVPVDLITDVAGDTVFLDAEREDVMAAPEGDSLDRDHLEAVARSFGRTPYWAEGYVPHEWGRIAL